MNREDECEYDDKRQKSRTQKLKEKLFALEERIRELESGPPVAEPDTLSAMFNSPSPSGSSNSPDLFGTPGYGAIDLPEYQGQTFGQMPVPPWARSSMSSASSSSSADSVSLGFHHDHRLSSGDILTYDEPDAFTTGVNQVGMSGFTDLPASMTYPFLSHWDPKDPMPYENQRIL
jgi:hypothetical protein